MARDQNNPGSGAFGDTVFSIAGCDLQVVDEPWPWAVANRDAIESYWLEASLQQSKFFNGTVHVVLRHECSNDCYCGRLARTDFASTLYWRRQNYPDVSVWDAFGSGVIRASCGAILLGRQSGGNLNAGMAYPPGGFIDENDVREGGRIDLGASIEREITEETGIDPTDLQREPGFLVSARGQLISINSLYRSTLAADDLRESVLAHMTGEHEPELADIIMVRDMAQADTTPMPGYARQLVRYLLA